MPQRRIKFVDELPEGHDFMAIRVGRDDLFVFYRRDAVSEQVLEDSWAAVRALDPAPPQEVALRSVS